MNKSLQPEIGGEIRPDFVPAADYTAEQITALEKEGLWPKIWHIACREEEIPNVGDFVNYEVCDESILVVRTKKDEFKAYYNVCQHRGRRLRDEPRGNVAQGFYCQFHGWRYALDGHVTYIHNREDWEACPRFKESNYDLKEPKIGRWAGWLWVNMDPDAPPLLEWLDAIVPRLKNFEIEKMKFAWYETIIAPVNWKVVMEAFNEGYHSGATHAYWLDYKKMIAPGHVHGRNTMYYTQFKALPTAKRDNGQWAQTGTLQDLLYYQSLEIYKTLFSLVMDPMMKAVERVRAETAPNASEAEIFGKLWDFHKEEIAKAGLRWPEKLTPEEMGNAGTGWHIFPNTIMLPAIDGVLWYRMRPYGDDPDQCIFDIWCLRPYAEGTEPKVTPHVSHGFEEFRGRNPFLEQDFANMVAVNKGMKSSGWLGAVLSPFQEIQISHFHKVLREYLFGRPAQSFRPPVEKKMSVGTKPKPARAKTKKAASARASTTKAKSKAKGRKTKPAKKAASRRR